METGYQREIKNRVAFLEKQMPKWVSWTGIVVILAVWQIICQAGVVSELFLPSPLAIVQSAWELIGSGELLLNIEASLYRIVIGFVIGSAAGIAIGLLVGFSKLSESIGIPIIYSLYPIPKIALLPLIILWLGIGEVSKVTIISLGVFFPVVINTYSGVKNVDSLLIKAAISFKASRWSVIRKVILPGALPMVFAGLKLASGTSLLLLIAAEMIAAKEGIGSMILHYGDLMSTTKLMVGVLVLSLLGLLFNRALHWLEKRLIPWKV